MKIEQRFGGLCNTIIITNIYIIHVLEIQEREAINNILRDNGLKLTRYKDKY